MPRERRERGDRRDRRDRRERQSWRDRRASISKRLEKEDNAKSRRGGKRHSVFTAAIIGVCLLSLLQLDYYMSSPDSGRRSLLSNLYLQATSGGTLLPWAHHHLVDVTVRPDPERETAMFFHIPKAGGTTVKRFYQCTGHTLAHRVGGDPRFGHDKDRELMVFNPFQGKDFKVVNVDTTVKQGILRAKKLGLVQSNVTDMIFTMEPSFAGENLYDEEHQGRILALFRHPVERAVSMFYYLQTATWEKTYRPEWKNITLEEWASRPNQEENYVVHKLVGKSFGDPVSEVDLIIAKELVRQRFIVGLMDEMEESIRRFNVILGLDSDNDRSKQCMEEFFGAKDVTPVVEDGEKTKATDKKNSNPHPKVEEGSPGYEALAQKNYLDMLLHNFIVTLFDEQKSIIDSYFIDPEEDLLAESRSTEQVISPDSPNPELSLIPAEIRDNVADFNGLLKKNESEIPFFFHVPKSGGTTVQRMYWCMGFTIANEVGGRPKFDEAKQVDLVSFKPWDHSPGKVVNVDVSTTRGIALANDRGFLVDHGSTGGVDLVSSSEFFFASEILFGQKYKARMFALFRNPIERAASTFYYLRKASWEPTYKPHWVKITIEEWSQRDHGDNNWVVRHLVNKGIQDPLTLEDVEKAKEIIRTKFVIGLVDRFDESMRRFNMYLGVDESSPENKKCIDEFTNLGEKSVQGEGKDNNFNKFSHPEIKKGSPAWINLAKTHYYDILLYRFISQQFHVQTAFFQPASES